MNPTRNLLLDSRFSSLEIHASGIQALNRSGPVNNTYSYIGVAGFPSLGYVPITYVSLIDYSSDVVSYPLSTDVNGRVATGLLVKTFANEIQVNYNIGGGNGAFNASFAYVVFRSPA
ncbi:hypothetical protein [Endobacterium cereale]|uniref:hypothetical protein n=1 Tax=Endobacterium cereale TaxID=2663029 RepID=UPI002B46B7F0|nr:hypothetical protein [Endobacterium cereale]MEB2845937.1 hypothetical protein [Endobacterium cereale]